ERLPRHLDHGSSLHPRAGPGTHVRARRTTWPAPHRAGLLRDPPLPYARPGSGASGTSRALGKPPSSSGLGPRPFTAVARVRIPLGVRTRAECEVLGPVAQLVRAPPCHG